MPTFQAYFSLVYRPPLLILKTGKEQHPCEKKPEFVVETRDDANVPYFQSKVNFRSNEKYVLCYFVFGV